MDYARKIRETVTTVTKYLIGGLAGGVASTLTNPLDVVRIRLQNQTSGQQQYTGMVQGMGACWREEGMRGLTRGLYASWGRELTYSSARIGLYEPIRGFVDQAVGGESHGNSQEINPFLELEQKLEMELLFRVGIIVRVYLLLEYKMMLVEKFLQ